MATRKEQREKRLDEGLDETFPASDPPAATPPASQVDTAPAASAGDGRHREATGTWRGDLRTGRGRIDAPSGVLADSPYSFATRFGDASGTNPEELIAAAHAACFSMALANHLDEQGHEPRAIETTARVTIEDLAIQAVHLSTRGRVPGISSQDFERLAAKAERACPVSNALRRGVAISLEATLEQ